MAPRARSTPAVSTAMVSALDALSSVLVTEHPRREARGLDRVVGAERRPVDVAPRIRRPAAPPLGLGERSEEHTSELQSHSDLVCRLLLEKKNQRKADAALRRNGSP